MDKKKLTAKVAHSTGLTHVQAAKSVEAVFETIRECTSTGETTIIHGFGSFSVCTRAERHGMNPSTKQLMKIPAHKVVKFKPSKAIVLK